MTQRAERLFGQHQCGRSTINDVQQTATLPAAVAQRLPDALSDRDGWPVVLFAASWANDNHTLPSPEELHKRNEANVEFVLACLGDLNGLTMRILTGHFCDLYDAWSGDRVRAYARKIRVALGLPAIAEEAKRTDER